MSTVDTLQPSENASPHVMNSAPSCLSPEKDKASCPESIIKRFFEEGGGDLGKFLKSQSYSNKIKNCTFNCLRMNKVLFEDIDFENCVFRGSLFKTAKVSRVHFTSCTFTDSCIAAGTIEEVQFKWCHLNSFDFYDSSLKEVSFISSTLPYSSFTDSELEKIQFISTGLLGTSFLGAKVRQSAIIKSDLTDTLFVECEKEFVISQCKNLPLNKRPVIALGWDFTNPQKMACETEFVYKTKNVNLLRYPNSHPKVEVFQLQKKVKEECEKISQSLPGISKAEALIRGAISGTEVKKIKERAQKIVESCDGLNLPGGVDVNEIFYKVKDKAVKSTNDTSIKKKSNSQDNLDVRRDLLEFCLLEEFEKAGKPAIGQCRGIQVLNVKKGGTLKNLKEEQGMEDKQLQVPSSKRALFEKKLPSGVFAYSAHAQAVDHLGKELHVVVWDKDIPEIIVNEKGNFLFTQFHPEVYIEETADLCYPIRREGFSPYPAKQKANEIFFDIFLDKIKEDIEKRRKPA